MLFDIMAICAIRVRNRSQKENRNFPSKGDKMHRTLAILMVLAPAAFVGASAQQMTGVTAAGLKAGGTISDQVGKDAKFDGDNPKYMGGFTGGGFVTYNLSDMIAVQPELLFTMKGVRYNLTENGAGVTERNELNYLELPVLLKLMPTTQGNIRPELFAGPSFAYLLSARAKTDIGGNTQTVDVKDNFKNFDFGVSFGAGVGYALSQGRLGLDARYTVGLVKVDHVAPISDVRNSAFSIMADYSFR
jgi:hypothetical protein